jgi:DNA polymerase/3'-5' exonuclease PolX
MKSKKSVSLKHSPKKSKKTVKSKKKLRLNFKKIIIDELSVLVKKETILKNFFKIRAYNKIIKQIELKDQNSIKSMKDLDDVSGIGVKIKAKLEEIFKNGKLKAAETARATMNLNIYDDLLSIHGVGIMKAKELIEKKSITSISQLKKKVKKHPELLNDQQKTGLKYFKDLRERIPRKEMDLHKKFLTRIFKKIDNDIEFSIVGSYRRKELDSGDIDILINSASVNSKTPIFKDILDYLHDKGYIRADLSKGKKKYMGIVGLPNKKSRRLDILITNDEEYPFAKLYFTGDTNTNIVLRKQAINQGLRLNEHSLTSRQGKKIKLYSEKEIFNYLGFDYIPPSKRTITPGRT